MTNFASPMLISEIPGYRDRINAQAHVFVQPKLDGWCCMANTRTRRIYTRQGNEITTLPHINAALPTDGPEWLHGELYAHDTTLGQVASMIKQGDQRIALHVFDCVSDNGFKERIEIIYSVSLRSRPLVFEPHWDVNQNVRGVPEYQILPYEIDRVYNEYLNQGYEGMIIRLDGHGYEHKRSINVFKMKPSTEVRLHD